MSGQRIADSKRRAGGVALGLAALGAVAQFAGWGLIRGDALVTSVVLFAGSVLGVVALVLAVAALVGRGPRLLPIVAIVVAAAPAVALVAATALTPLPEY